MLGVAYLFENKPDEARREFRKLLELRPDYRFDPLLDPPAGRRLLQRRGQGGGGDDRRDRRRGAASARSEIAARTPARGRAPAHAARRSCATNGIRSRSTSSRSAPASSRTASGARAGCSSARRPSLARGLGGRVRHQPRALRPRRRTASARSAADGQPSARRRRSITRRRTRRARCSASRSSAAALFFAVAIWGVIDAIRHYQREVPLPDGAKVARAPAPPRGAAPHVFARRPRRRLGILKGIDTMATLKFAVPGKGPKVYHIYKKITSLGRGEEADIVAARSAAGRQPRAHPLRRPRLQHRDDRASDAELFVNGKKRNKHQLHARGPHPDRQRPRSSSRCTTSRSPTTTAAQDDGRAQLVQASSTSSPRS